MNEQWTDRHRDPWGAETGKVDTVYEVYVLKQQADAIGFADQVRVRRAHASSARQP